MEQPTPPQPSRLEAARGRVVAARWLLAVAAGAGFGWALLGAKLANPGDPASTSGAQEAPATETGATLPASAPVPASAPTATADPNDLLDEFFGDGAIAPDAGARDDAAPGPSVQDDAAPDAGGGSLSRLPSTTFNRRPRTHAS